MFGGRRSSTTTTTGASTSSRSTATCIRSSIKCGSARPPDRQRKLLYHNRGDGTFDEVAVQFGRVMMDEHVGRGLAAGDLDNDGRLDLVINNLDGAPEVLHNELADRGNWLLVKLTGSGRNTDAIGALVTARAGALTQVRLVQSGTSYISQNDMRLHFGLGAAAEVDALEVRWPDGKTSKMANVKTNQIVKIQQPR